MKSAKTTSVKPPSLGKTGEDIAVKHFVEAGYKIIERNFRYERAEVDIIAASESAKILAFAEVKTRTNKKFGEPEESVTESKQNQIIKAAEGYLSEHTDWDEYDKRFDVIAILKEGKNFTINHIENAF